MGTLAPELPTGSGDSLAGDLAGMGSFLIDPPAAARRLNRKWFWLGPLILFSVVSIAASLVMMPMTRHVMEVAPLPPNVSAEQYQRSISIGLTIQRFAMFGAPLAIAVIFAIQTLVLLGASAVLSVNAKFHQLFNLIAGCSVIQILSALAGIVVLKAKGEVSTIAELRPSLGLDIFLPANANKVVTAALGYFSVFEVWWIVMLVLIYSTAFRVTKGKAAVVIFPLVVLSLLLRVVGAVFSR